MLLSTGRFFSSAAAPGGGAWSPADLGAALLAWYKGDTVAGSNGAAIAPWTDHSGNGNNTTGGTSPTLATANLNGLNVLRWTASSFQHYTLPHIFSVASTGSAYLVIKTALDPQAIPGRAGFWRFGSETGASASCHYPFTDGSIYDGFGSTARKAVGNVTPALNSWRILGIHSAASDWGMRIDGTSVYSTVTNTVGFTSSPTLGQSWSTVANSWFDGWIAEAIFTNAKQSQADREKVEGYLAHKWGLTANLDAGHPYKSVAP